MGWCRRSRSLGCRCILRGPSARRRCRALFAGLRRACRISVDAEHADAAGHFGAGVVQDPDLRIRCQGCGPAVSQVAEASGFALDADSSVEGEGFADGVVVGGRVRADFLEFTNVPALVRTGRHQRPGVLDARFAHVEEAGADGREGPFVQADSVVIAVEVGDLIGELAEGVGAIDDGDDASGGGHVADTADGEDLAGAVGDVAAENGFGFGSDGLLEAVVEVVHACDGDREGNGFEPDAVAALALSEGREHAGVVLIGGEDFVAGFEVEAELGDFEGFAGITSDGDLFGVDTGSFGDHAAGGFDFGFEFPDHGVIRAHVGVVEVAAHGFLDAARGGAGVAVVEVDDGAVSGEFVADAGPEVFVSGGGGGGGRLRVENCCGGGELKQVSAIHRLTSLGRRRRLESSPGGAG